MKKCQLCQKPFEPASNNSRYCSSSCRAEAQKISNRNRRQKNNSTVTIKAWKYCYRTDCLYYNDSWNYANRCDYLWLTGNLRGCGRGAECTKYKHSTPGERKKFRNTVTRKDEEGRNKPIFYASFARK